MLRKGRLLELMYGDPDLKKEAAESDIEHEKQEHELQMLKDKIALQIDKAKIDQETKDHIRQMALNGTRKRKK